jgi:hypothetical protein
MRRARAEAIRARRRFKAPIFPAVVAELRRVAWNVLDEFCPPWRSLDPSEIAIVLNNNGVSTYSGTAFDRQSARELSTSILKIEAEQIEQSKAEVAALVARFQALLQRPEAEWTEADKADAIGLVLTSMEDRWRTTPALMKASDLLAIRIERWEQRGASRKAENTAR